jgi:NAD(P)-dependent dehydrogenase (short-subunit alcohol dehydrogenase family)
MATPVQPHAIPYKPSRLTPNTVMLSAKTTSDASTVTPFPPDPNSPQSTINTVEREIREAGGHAATVAVDVRDAAQIQHAVEETVRVFGKLDVLVYNSGAIWWSSVENTPLKRFKLMQQVNPEGLYATVQAALPFFEQRGWKGRIIVVSPPIYSRFFRGKTAYAMGEFMPLSCGFWRLESTYNVLTICADDVLYVGKVGMSVLVKGLAMDFVRQGRNEMAVTSIWPASVCAFLLILHRSGFCEGIADCINS